MPVSEHSHRHTHTYTQFIIYISSAVCENVYALGTKYTAIFLMKDLLSAYALIKF